MLEITASWTFDYILLITILAPSAFLLCYLWDKAKQHEFEAWQKKLTIDESLTLLRRAHNGFRF
jgi:hypothetical protein